MKYLFAKFIHKVQIPAITRSKIAKTARVCSKSHVYESAIDEYSYIGNDCKVFYTRIGKYCSIADGCFFGGAQHPIENVSTSPVFHKGKNIMGVNFAFHDAPPEKEIIIGNDVWIGAFTLIKSGVRIGDGAVIAMGAVVTHDVKPYTIVGGVPAKYIRDRFPKHIVSELESICWWDWEEEKIRRYASDFDDVEKFIEHVKREDNR